MIKPFENIKKKLGPNRFASTRYVDRRLREVLGKLHITGKGCNLSASADGQIHIEVPANNDVGDHPFKATTFVAQSNGRTGVLIAPGLVYSNALPGPTPWMLPQIGHRDLTTSSASPPALAPSGILSYLCLVCKFDTDGTAMETPWQIEAFNGSPPQNTPLVRIGSASGAAQQGVFHVLIATVENGQIYQWVRRNISVNLQWENPFVSA